MRKKTMFIVFGVILMILIVVAMMVGGCGGDGDEEFSGTVDVPIELKAADNVGSLSIEMTYDPEVLHATEVTQGELASNAMLEFNLDNTGEVIIGIVDSSGISGNGAVAIISFEVVDSERASNLSLVEVKTHDATTLIDIINETSDGSVEPKGLTIEGPVIEFSR